ncbi:Uncharacterised protein [Actinomyces bovis]|uniref:DUF7916 domain-containing protein n=1 Tax=Actinomyces bovis TaxID=1658 RepID=A0ABY1VQX2_9ACTO|nr:hypothetical protein [Actinomyces bovis]SPT54142.1 Uncharacterised protein [Actinomyces bovis]VEG53610.1 Uncharacterised protein [Actinomyces israelii]
MSRILDLSPKALTALRGMELVDSIRQAEGRTIAAETIVAVPPLQDGCSNPELAAAFGADIICLNLYDVAHPQVWGLPDADNQPAPPAEFGDFPAGRGRTAGDVARYTGRLTAVNLEPVDPARSSFPAGRRATVDNAERLVEQGGAIAVITGNPGSGVTMEAIVQATVQIRAATDGQLVIFAGRMHAAGAGEPVMTTADILRLADAGAHGVLQPAPGTTPGSSMQATTERVQAAQARGLLVWNSIGTSQEGASRNVIERIGMDSKASGADVHHIGDSGYFGIAPPENIYAYSLAIRGRRHTWHRMARSQQR